jgi:hypothetical protein
MLVRCLHTNESHQRFSQNGVHIWQSQLRLIKYIMPTNLSWTFRVLVRTKWLVYLMLQCLSFLWTI